MAYCKRCGAGYYVPDGIKYICHCGLVVNRTSGRLDRAQESLRIQRLVVQRLQQIAEKQDCGVGDIASRYERRAYLLSLPRIRNALSRLINIEGCTLETAVARLNTRYATSSRV